MAIRPTHTKAPGPRRPQGFSWWGRQNVNESDLAEQCMFRVFGMHRGIRSRNARNRRECYALSLEDLRIHDPSPDAGYTSQARGPLAAGVLP